VGRVIQTLPEGETVDGVTSLDNHLYVLRGNKSPEHLEVYDIDSDRLLHCLTVPGLGDRRDIVACRHNRCAYNYFRPVTQLCSQSSTVRRHSNPLAGRWQTTLTYTHGVLVTCWKVRQIKEFSTDGQLLHVLTLPQDVVSPWHAVQLSSGQFIMCHAQCVNPIPLHRVCLLGSDGSVVKSFGGAKSSGSELMNAPTHMAGDRNEFVFVVDANNNRVLLLSPHMYVMLSCQWCCGC